MSELELRIMPDENEEHFIWRLGQAKDSGILNMDWNSISDIINAECRKDDSEYRNESVYRKAYQQAKRFYEAGVFKQYADEDDYIKQLRQSKQDIRIEKQKLFDERRELNAKLREQARRESFIDIIASKILNVKPLELNYTNRDIVFSNNDLVCHLTDIHAGINIDSWYNTYNMEVLAERLRNYLNQIEKIQNIHHSENCYLIVGEILSGLIRETLRIENNENVIQQFIEVSSLISEFIAELSNTFNKVFVYITPGNHSRVVAKKEHAIRGENFDLLLPYYLEARLQNYINIVIKRNEKDCDVAMFNVRGNRIMAVHGDKDTVGNVVQHFTMVFGEKPDIVYMGHMHTNALTTVYDTKVIQSGCVSGSDNYCIDKRLKNRSEQTVSVVDKDGLLCLYDVKVD